VERNPTNGDDAGATNHRADLGRLELTVDREHLLARLEDVRRTTVPYSTLRDPHVIAAL